MCELCNNLAEKAYHAPSSFPCLCPRIIPRSLDADDLHLSFAVGYARAHLLDALQGLIGTLEALKQPRHCARLHSKAPQTSSHKQLLEEGYEGKR